MKTRTSVIMSTLFQMKQSNKVKKKIRWTLPISCPAYSKSRHSKNMSLMQRF